MPKNIITQTAVFCLALVAFALFCSPSLSPAVEEKSEEDMSDAERLHRSLEKGLKNRRFSLQPPKGAKNGSQKGPKQSEYKPDSVDLIIESLEKKNLTDSQMVVEAIKMAKNSEQELAILRRLSVRDNYTAMSHLGSKMIWALEDAPHHDLYEGFRLMATAARAGDAQAQQWLANAIYKDLYLGADLKMQQQEEFRWSYAAAEQGYAQGQLIIGQMLERGIAPGKRRGYHAPTEDFISAYTWLTLALNRFSAGPVKKGSLQAEYAGFARNSLKYLVKKGYVNAEQINEALKRAEEWEKSHPDAYKKYPLNELDPYK